jgi:pimeloyl-ACP methyl ester carboxylesterase
MKMPKRTTIAGLAGLALAVAPAVARARWATTPDPTDGRPLELPPGEELSITTSDGATLGATRSGPPGGRLVVAAHGWTEDRRIWGPMARRLIADGHQVVAYDQRGHGRSTVGADGLTIDAIAADLRAVLDFVDAHDAVITGHSMGGMAAQAFAIRHKDALAERVAALVLVSTAADGLSPTKTGLQLASHAVGSPALTRVFGSRLAGPFLVRSSVGRRAALSHLQATAQMFADTSPEVRRGFLDAMGELNLCAGLPGVTVPTVVVTGTRDTLTPVRLGRRISELVPGARLELLPGLGHQLVFEAPDRLADIVEELLSARRKTTCP